MNDEQLKSIMEIITQSGNAKNEMKRAITAAKNGDHNKAASHVDRAHLSIVSAHSTHSELLVLDAEDKLEINLYLIHAQDHLMTTMMNYDLTKELIEIYYRLDSSLEP